MKFNHGDLAEVYNTTSDALDGQIVTILGRSYHDSVYTAYIVGLDIPVVYEDGFSATAVSITEHCLREWKAPAIVEEEVEFGPLYGSDEDS